MQAPPSPSSVDSTTLHSFPKARINPHFEGTKIHLVCRHWRRWPTARLPTREGRSVLTETDSFSVVRVVATSGDVGNAGISEKGNVWRASLTMRGNSATGDNSPTENQEAANPRLDFCGGRD